MSYAVIHMQKLKMGSIRGIENHNERLKESKTNPDIDYEKSHLNKDLMEHDNRSYYMRVKDRIEELDLPKAVRKDAVVSCGFICTSDQSYFNTLTQAEKDKFFQVSHDFIKNRYGEKNVIASKVHYDETTPHSHTYIVPVTEDGRLSAKSIFTPKELRSLQDDYYKTMREQGFDLERGEGKNKHLSVQEYKIETKFAELKEKQAELEKLEQIDKTVHLNAEKGKFMYSTQEVDAIKEQNRALKVELNHKERQVQDLERKVEGLDNQLLKAQKDIKDMQVPLERLKDLESESEALKGYLEKYPKVAQALELHDKQIEQAYRIGNALHTFKQEYNQAKSELKGNIEQTYKIERTINEHDISLSRLSELETKVNVSKDRLKGLEDELENTKGIFKGKQRKEITEKIETEKSSLQQSTNFLKTEFNIEPFDIDRKRKAIRDRQEELKYQKSDYQFKSNQLETLMEKKVKSYKYHKAVSDSQDKPLKEISNRRDNKASVSYQDKKLFEINKGDRAWITDTMKEKHPQIIERVQENWKQEDVAKEMAKEVKQARGLSRGRGMER